MCYIMTQKRNHHRGNAQNAKTAENRTEAQDITSETQRILYFWLFNMSRVFCEPYFPATQDIITRKRDYHLGSREDTFIAQIRLGRKIGLTPVLQSFTGFNFCLRTPLEFDKPQCHCLWSVIIGRDQSCQIIWEWIILIIDECIICGLGGNNTWQNG